MAVTIARTHYTYSRRNGQAELAWFALLNTGTVYARTVTHLSTNPPRRRATFMRLTMLPLRQTATSYRPTNCRAVLEIPPPLFRYTTL